MKFCTHCGTSLPDRAEICPVCNGKCPVADEKDATKIPEASAAKSELKENQKISEAKAKSEAAKKAEVAKKAEADKKAMAKAAKKAEKEAETKARAEAKAEAGNKVKAEPEAEPEPKAAESNLGSEPSEAEKPSESEAKSEKTEIKPESKSEPSEAKAAEKTQKATKAEKPKETVKPESKIGRTDSRALFLRLSVIFAVIAALASATFVLFFGVSVKVTVPPRDVDPEVFYYFAEHGFSYFLKPLDAAKATELITETGFYPTEQLVRAYVTLSTVRSIVMIASLVLIDVFTLLAVVELVRYAGSKNAQNTQNAGNGKNGESGKSGSGSRAFRPVWAIAAVATYVCCVVAVRMFDYGKIAFVFKSGNKTVSASELSMGLNAPTVIGLCLSILLVAASLVTDYMSKKNSEIDGQKASSVGAVYGYSLGKLEAEKRRKTLKTGTIAVYCIAGLALLTILISGFTAVSSTTKGFGEMQIRDPQTGEYKTMSGAREFTETMPLTSLLRKYSLEEEETLYEIGNVEKLLARYPDNLEWIIRKEELDAELATIREKETYAFNFGISMTFSELATMVFSGLLAVYVLCLRDKLNGELLVVVSLLPVIFAFVTFAVGIFLLRSFGKIQIELGIVAPFMTLLTSAAACVLTFFVRKSILKKRESEKQVLS